MKGSAAGRRVPDPTIYPEEERLGEDILQRWIVEMLRPLLQRWLSSRRIVALVGADQFIYYRPHDAHARVSPDIYVLPGISPRRRVRSWKTWVDEVVPSFALEVVSHDWEKDYIEVIDRYDDLGIKELLVFDPDHRQNKQRVRWQVFRPVGKRGLVRIESTNDDRVRSKVLGCWLVAVGANGETRLRIGIGANGSEFFATAEEAERLEKEHERQSKEDARAAAEHERLEKEAARADAASARALLEQERAEKEAALARLRAIEASPRRRR